MKHLKRNKNAGSAGWIDWRGSITWAVLAQNVPPLYLTRNPRRDLAPQSHSNCRRPQRYPILSLLCLAPALGMCRCRRHGILRHLQLCLSDLSNSAMKETHTDRLRPNLTRDQRTSYVRRPAHGHRNHAANWIFLLCPRPHSSNCSFARFLCRSVDITQDRLHTQYNN